MSLLLILYTYIIVFPVLILTAHEKLWLFLEIFVEYLGLLLLIQEATLQLLLLLEKTCPLSLFQKRPYIFILSTFLFWLEPFIRFQKRTGLFWSLIFDSQISINVTYIYTGFSAVHFVIHHARTVNRRHQHLVQFVGTWLLFNPEARRF